MATNTERGVLARIEVSDEGVKLVLEDMKGGGRSWTVDAPFTSKTFSPEEFLGENRPASQFEQIGLALVSRLAVLHASRSGSESR
jgi:hypothetical protein